MYKRGLKLWSVNTDYYYDEAIRLYNAGIYDYIELYVVPETLETLPKWKALAFPSFGGVSQSDGVVRNTKNYMKLPYNPELKEYAKELRKAGNLSEVLLWNEIKNKKFNGLDFDRQKIIGNYIVDFYCASHNVVIEIDGSSHDDKEEYDTERNNFLKGLGLEVIHIADRDVKSNLDGVVKYIYNHPAFGTPPEEGNDPAFGTHTEETTPSLRDTPPKEGNICDCKNSPPLEEYPLGGGGCIPFIIHNPHFAQGFNLAKQEKAERNRKIYEQTKQFADELNAKYIIFHGGIDGDIRETAIQLAFFNEPRALIENKPFVALPNRMGGEFCRGYNIDEIKTVMNTANCGFCLDFGHAICAANSLGINVYDYCERFLNLNPQMFHLTDIDDITSVYDSHPHLGAGQLDFNKIFGMIPDNSYVTFETVKDSKEQLDDFVKDMKWLKNFQ